MEINKDLKVKNHTLEEIETEAYTPYKISEIYTLTSIDGWVTNMWDGSVYNYTYELKFKKTYTNRPLILVCQSDTTGATYWGGLLGYTGICSCSNSGCKVVASKNPSLADFFNRKCWISVIVISND